MARVQPTQTGARKASWRVLLLAAASVLLFTASHALAASEEQLNLYRRKSPGRRHSALHYLDHIDQSDLAKRAKSSSGVTCTSTLSPGFDVSKVAGVATGLASHSWEYGVVFDALLELCSPTHSVFASTAFPSGKVPSVKVSTHTALAYIKPLIRTNSSSLIDGAGSLTDPASLTTGAVLVGQTTPAYLTAAKSQIATLYAGPKFYNGAISARADVAELWADAMYMLTPALAYYSPATQDTQYIENAVKQATYYRQVLQANTTADWQGLWVHIVGPQSATYGIWLTGNGWAALGMVRILAVMTNWTRTAKWTTRPALIKKYIYEILDGCMAVGFSPDGSGLLANYLVGDSSGQNAKAAGNFGDAAGTAMIASVAYRMMVLDPAGAKGYKTWANQLRKAVAAQVKSNGYVNQTVNPYDWFDNQPYTAGSPEGQAAAVLMATAYGACVSASQC